MWFESRPISYRPQFGLKLAKIVGSTSQINRPYEYFKHETKEVQEKKWKQQAKGKHICYGKQNHKRIAQK